MFTIDGAALSFADARKMEKKCVDQTASEGDPDRYMIDVAGEVSAAVARLTSLPVGWNGQESASEADSDDRSEAEGADWAPNRVIAFVGGGDNGGDALYASAILARAGIGATAYLLKKRCHRRALAAAREAGVTIVDLSDRSLRSIEGTPEWDTIWGAGIWIDGMVGIGAQGPLTGKLAEAVTLLNGIAAARPRHIVAIDVPSGLTDDDGAIRGPILRATCTMAVGAYKRAEILPPAVEYSGDLSIVAMPWSGSNPMEEEDEDMVPLSYGAGTMAAAMAVPAPGFAQDKYARGVVGLVAGSDTYPGAGLLATRGALAAGVGMVRLNSTRRVQDLVLADQPGVVTVGGRIQSALIGPGLDDERREDALELAQFCGRSGMPLVIDAWALDLVPELLGSLRPDVTVLTPHYGEAARLLGLLGQATTKAQIGAHPLRFARALHDATGCHVVLKGPVTIVCSDAVARARTQAGGRGGDGGEESPQTADTRRTSGCRASVSPAGTPWAGVAGSGDVLAGLIAGVLARPEPTAPSGEANALPVTMERLAAAVWLHGRAARLAADRHRGRAPIQAADIAAQIPRVLADPERRGAHTPRLTKRRAPGVRY